MYVGRRFFKCNHLKSLEWRNLPTTHSIQFNLIQKTLFVPKGQLQMHKEFKKTHKKTEKTNKQTKTLVNKTYSFIHKTIYLYTFNNKL